MIDRARIDAIVQRLANELLPGWDVTWTPVKPDAIGGNLAMVKAYPARQIARVAVAEHPPNESYEESLAHEFVHAVISPLVDLIEESPASIMVEEPIAERLGKFIAKYARLRGAVARALHSPRTASRIVRQRISAIATRQRIAGRTNNVDPKMIEEIIAAIKDGNGDAAIELLTKLLASAAGGMAGGPDSSAGAARDDEGAAQGDGATAYRADEPQAQGKMRMSELDKTLLRARQAESKANAAARGASQITIRARIRELRGDGVQIDAETEKKLVALGDVDAAEERIEYLVKGRETAATRARSGVTSSGAKDGASGSPSLEQLTREYPEQVARDISRAFEKGADHGEVAMKAAAKFRKAAPNG